MAKGKLILICQSGGEFITNEDGTMTYNGGEANAANVTSETPFNDLKLNLAETCNLNQETVSVKYFLPGNKRNLITVKNDKDVKRMIDFHGDALTAEVFVMGTPGFIRTTVEEIQVNRENVTKNDETANNDKLNTKKDKKVKPKKDEKVKPKKDEKVKPKKDKKVKKEAKAVKKSPNAAASPAKRTRRALAAAKTETEDAKSASSPEDSSTSEDSEKVNKNVDSEVSSDFVPSRYPKRKKPEANDTTSPADGVKKRRRTPSWKLGANGRPTIVSSPEASAGSKSRGKRKKAVEEASGSRKSQRKSNRLAAKEEGVKETKSAKKRGRPRRVKAVVDTSDQEVNELVGPDALALRDDDMAPESGNMLNRDQLHGSDKEAYNKLPWFSEKIIETNPGSVLKLVIGEKKRFKSLFVAFYASLCGFQNSCRPLLFLESTSLRSRYGEVLLTANAIDGNDGFFPVAFSIVDVEDDNNWRLFLENLKIAISNAQQPMTFVFDREKNLKTSILEVFGEACIGYSIYHLLESFKRNVKGPFHGDGKSFLPFYFLEAAHAVRLVGFRKSMEQIKQISSQAYDWVMQIEPQHWTTSSFHGERYNHVIDDVSGPIAKLMEEYQELPILHKADALIRWMIDAITDAKLDGSMWSTHLTPSKEKQLQEENVRSCGLKVLISSDTLFEVREDSTHVVNLGNWSCTCLGWKETGLPCRHALAVFALIGRNPYEFCSSYFTVEAYRITYAVSIAPVPVEEEEFEKIEMKSGGVEVEEGEKIEVAEEKGEKIEVIEEKNEVKSAGGENEEGEKIEVEVVEEKIEEIKNAGGVNEQVAESEGNNVIIAEEVVEIEKTEEEKVEKEEGLKEGGEEEEGMKEGGEKEEGLKEGGGKDEGDKGKVKEGEKEEEEEDDPNVVVLPPIPAKGVDPGKEKMEWDEAEVETKRTVTCTKCKQPGHNKKSCNLYQAQQAS